MILNFEIVHHIPVYVSTYMQLSRTDNCNPPTSITLIDDARRLVTYCLI